MSRRRVVRFGARLATDDLQSMQETWNQRASEYNEQFSQRRFRTRRGAMKAITNRGPGGTAVGVQPYAEGVVPRIERLG